MSQEQQWRVIDVEGNECGPYTADQLQVYAADGTISPTTQVWTDGLDEWISAAQVEGLFPGGARRPQLLTGSATSVGRPPGSPGAAPLRTAPAIKVSQPRSGAATLVVLGIAAPLLILGAYFLLTRSTPETVAAKKSPEPIPENALLPEKKPSPAAATAQAPGEGAATDDSDKQDPSATGEPLFTLEQWVSMTPDEVLTDNQVMIDGPLTAAQWESVNAIAKLGGRFMMFSTDDLFLAAGTSGPSLTLTKETIDHLKRLDMIRTIRMYRCDVEEDALAHFKELIHIETLDLEDLPLPITDAFLAHLGEMPKLRCLSIWTMSKDSKTTDTGMAHLGRLSNLEVLNIQNADAVEGEITDAGLQHLSGLTELKELRLACRTHSMSDAGLAYLVPLKKLTSLFLPSGITDAGMAQVGSFRNLKSVGVFCPGITDAGLASLSGLSNLTSLDIRGCDGITDAGLATLPGFSNLEVLLLVGMPQLTDGSLVHLEKCKGLKQLTFSNMTGVTQQGILKLREALEGCEIIVH